VDDGPPGVPRGLGGIRIAGAGCWPGPIRSALLLRLLLLAGTLLTHSNELDPQGLEDPTDPTASSQSLTDYLVRHSTLPLVGYSHPMGPPSSTAPLCSPHNMARWRAPAW
jgi:hypothetical protein